MSRKQLTKGHMCGIINATRALIETNDKHRGETIKFRKHMGAAIPKDEGNI